MVQFVSKKRQTASKVWITDLHNGKYSKGGGFNPNYIEVGGKQIARVQLMATIVGKFLSEDGNYGTITLDDGTETIRVKAFGPDVLKLKGAGIGSVVRFIGKPKEYNSEVYLAPEIIREIDNPNWIIVNKLELGNPISGIPAPEEVKPVIDERSAEKEIVREGESIQKRVLELIRGMDNGEGAEMDKVIAASMLDPEEGKQIIIGLLKAGELFEPRKGKLKVLD